ncbi:MAG: NapC/NirT family cytochrome c, partial [Gammaproteobacteria bacterium]|nr:NapC/NirT family cytochrome c [Gammaproteobacteria bacterium]
MSKLNEFRNWLNSRGGRYTVGNILLAGIIIGVITWGAFNTLMEATNTEAFCLSCHEMRDYVYQEYQ